jgi:hypothetical protein
MKHVPIALLVAAFLATAPIGLASAAQARTPGIAPYLEAGYSPANVVVGGTTSLQFGIENLNAEAIGGVNFTNNLPSALRLMSGTSSVCGGTLTLTKATGFISLTGATIAAVGSGTNWCRFSIPVTAFDMGSWPSTSSAVKSSDTYDGNKASTTANVYVPPKITAVFTPDSIDVGATSQLRATILNPSGNPITLSNIGATSTLPPGIPPIGYVGPMCGGTFSFTSGSSVALTGVSLAPGASCLMSVGIFGSAAGDATAYVVATLDGAVYPGNGATATLHVGPGPTPTPTDPPAIPPTPAPGATHTPVPAVGAASPDPGVSPALPPVGGESSEAPVVPADGLASASPASTDASPAPAGAAGASAGGPSTPATGFPVVALLVGLAGMLLLVCVVVALLLLKRRRAVHS